MQIFSILFLILLFFWQNILFHLCELCGFVSLWQNFWFCLPC